MMQRRGVNWNIIVALILAVAVIVVFVVMLGFPEAIARVGKVFTLGGG